MSFTYPEVGATRTGDRPAGYRHLTVRRRLSRHAHPPQDLERLGEQLLSWQVHAAARVRELTGGYGVDVAFEALGSAATFATALDVLDDGGRAVVVGIAPAGATGAVDLQQGSLAVQSRAVALCASR